VTHSDIGNLLNESCVQKEATEMSLLHRLDILIPVQLPIPIDISLVFLCSCILQLSLQ